MDPDARTAILGVGVAFVALLAALTLGVIADSGLDILSLTSLVVIALLAFGLIGALRNPPD
jgi:hypothetical protein